MSELNAIDFSSLPLIGRDEESERLEEAFEEISREKPKNNGDCIFIAGKSGCGKTQLVLSLRSNVVYSGGTFAAGKFDQLSSTRPYSALTDAIGNLCQALYLAGEEAIADVVSHLGSDLPLLHTLVPSSRITLKTDMVNGKDPHQESISQWMFLRLKQMIWKLFQAVTKLGPFVLFLDDLQWCDASSIELINFVLRDKKLTNFLFIGAYRNDELTAEQELFKLDRFNEEACTIQLKGLSEEDLNKLVAAALRLDVLTTLPLAKEIHRKTAGNCFFVVHFLKFLEYKKILAFSLHTYQWTWDMKRLASETESSDNVAEVVASKLQNLPAASQSALAVAACFGNKFSGDVLEAMLKALSAASNSQFVSSPDLRILLLVSDCASDVDEVLTAAVKEGFVDKLQSFDDSEMAVYKFAHDKIQTAAYDLVKSSDRLHLHSIMGKILWKMLPDTKSDQRDALLVQVVEQLHRAGLRLFVEDDDLFRVEVARLNLEAAHSVKRNAAFLTAAEYLRSSASLLGEQRWSSHYSLTLATLNLRAEMELCCRRYLRCKRTILEIISNATCIEDKMQAYVVLVDYLRSEKRTDEILQTVYSVVARLGFRTPKRKATFPHVVRKLLQTKKEISCFSDQKLLTYRICDDRAIEGCLKLLSRTAGIAWMAHSMHDVAFISMLMCTISLTKGFTKYSANAFGSYGLMLCKMGDFKAARRYGRLALEISDRFQAKECDGYTMFLYYGFIHHTSKPMPELLDPLLQASQLAKAGGDIENSHHICLVYTFTYIICGLPLNAIEQDAKLFIDEIKQYKRSSALNHIRLLRQMTLNLIKRSRDTFRLEGKEIPNLQSLYKQGNEIKNQRTREGILNCQLLLACYLGRGKEGKEIASKHAKLKDHENPICFSTVFPYLRGIVFLRSAREGCRGCKRLAARETRHIRSFVQKGFLNCTHLLLTLEAGLLSNNKKPDMVVRKAYDTAIACASRSGFPHDAGLASEHAAIHFGTRDPSRHEIYHDRAIEFYQQWGAGAKVEMLEEEFGGGGGTMRSHSGDGTSTVSSAIRGRSRRDAFHLNSEHETTDWFNNTSTTHLTVRRNLSIRRQGLPMGP